MPRFLDLVLGPGWVVFLLFMMEFLSVTSENDTAEVTTLGTNLVNVTTLGTNSVTLPVEPTLPSTDNVPDTAREPGQTNSTTEPDSVPKTSTDSVPKTSTDSVPKTTTYSVPNSSTEPVPKTTPCKVLVGIDEPLYDNYSKNMTKIVDTVNQHFQQINQIYNQNIFTGDLGGIYFKVSRIQVMFGSCDAIKYKNCTHQREKFLEIFDQYDFKEFCLAYMFTFRDFHNGTAGLASTPGLCRKEKNSGFITFLNYNLTRDMNETVLTLAHELGHSMGALHDNKVKKVNNVVEECNATEAEEDCGCGSGLIMEGFSNGTTSRQFSSCSVERIQDNIHAVMASEANCLLQEEEVKEMETALCGNYRVEPGEECDCGDNQISCNDPCCYPAHISTWERSSNQSALPCSRTSRLRCLSPPSLVYGVYLPLAFILAAVILTGVLLRHDWTREKKLFTHITRGNVRIVSRRQNRRIAGEEPRPRPLYA